MITHYLMVVVVSFASFVIVKKHVIRKAISKIERMSIPHTIHERPEDANNHRE